jgi:hypothetical protein
MAEAMGFGRSEELAGAVAAGPDDPATFHRLGLDHARGVRIGALLELADQVGPKFGGSLVFFHNVAKDLVLGKEWEAIERLAAEVPEQRLEQAIALYYAGCALIAAGDRKGALALFQRFKSAVLRRHKEYPLASDQNFNLIFRQGSLVETPEFTRLLVQKPIAKAPPSPVFVETPSAEGAPFVLAICLDARYFTRFAPEVCRGYEALRTREPLHFHVIQADDASLALFTELKARHPALKLGLSREPAGPWSHPVYYSCVRFLVMEELIACYDRPMLAMDADIVPKLAPGTFVGTARDADFACFATGRIEPASAYQASVMYFSTSARAREFLSLLRRFVLAKMDLPPVLSWMLDQAAIYSVMAVLAEDSPDFTFRNLGEGLGQSIFDIQHELSTTEEKSRIMNRLD